MRIERERYLSRLKAKRFNGMIKVITGIRRCGKSFLLFELYHDFLIADGVPEECIVTLALDELSNGRYRDPYELDRFVREKTADRGRQYYVFLDEIQKVNEVRTEWGIVTFADVLLGLMKLKNVDLYVTGSNSKMLSSDVLTEFRGRGDEIRIGPLSYGEFCLAYPGDKRHAWRDYMTYGGMPLILSMPSHADKSRYLKDLFSGTYLADVLDRYRIRNEGWVLEDLLNILSSGVGKLTNPAKLSRCIQSEKHTAVSQATVARYLDYFTDAFLIEKSCRYDIKGKKYLSTPYKYYFTDVGLRNARLNFRQTEENHIMENILFNELRSRGYDVDVGVVERCTKDAHGTNVRTQLEVDFVVNRASERYYIQSAFMIPDDEKRRQETEPLCRIGDSFRKIIVVRDDIVPHYDDSGILYIGIERFLLDEGAMCL